MTTHVVINVEPDPARPLMMRFEMNDDGACPAGYTLARAIIASYPHGCVELITLDLLSHLVLSDTFAYATSRIDPADAEGIDRLRERLVKLAGYWDRHRQRFYKVWKNGVATAEQPEPEKPADGPQ